MGSSVVPLQKGFLYQAYYFWLEATGLFEGFSKIRQVGYEINGSKAFDDVQIHYSTPIRGERGESVHRDFFQLKFHIDLSGAVGFVELTDPAFIGGTKYSFLQRLKDLCDSNPGFAQQGRFHLFTNWPVKTDDPLVDLIGGTGGEIRIDKLRGAGGPKSRLGQIRETWKNHLGIADDEELYKLIAGIRLRCGGPSLEEMKKALSFRLNAVGLEPIDPTKATEPYSSLIFRLCHEGKSEFTREDLLAELEREKLVRKIGDVAPACKRLGVRSFFRYAERMENETEAMLPLEGYFDGRFIRDPALWNSSVRDEARQFVEKYMPAHSGASDVLLDAHSSIAVAIGSLLDPKRGVDVGVVQKGIRGAEVWHPSKPESVALPLLSVARNDVNGATGADVAVVINITRSANADVEKYVSENLRKVGKLLEYRLEDGIGPAAVRDGNHAWRIAEGLSEALRELRSQLGPTPIIHLFSAAPNGVLFFLGRLSSPAGKIQLYEFDFERKRHGSYEPSILLPW